MSTQTPDELITVRQAAKECERNPETIRRWIWSGKIPAEKLGNQLFVRRSTLERFIQETTVMSRDHTTLAFEKSNDGLEGESTRQIDPRQVEASGPGDGQPKADGKPTERGSRPGTRVDTINDMRLLREEMRSLGGNLDVELAKEELRRNRSDDLSSMR